MLAQGYVACTGRNRSCSCGTRDRKSSVGASLLSIAGTVVVSYFILEFHTSSGKRVEVARSAWNKGNSTVWIYLSCMVAEHSVWNDDPRETGF